MAEGMGSRWLVVWYLGLTPLFALVDLFADLPLRAAALDAPAHRVAFYGVLLAIGAACRLLPAAAPLLAVLESALAVAVLVIGAYLDVLGLPDAVLTGEARLGLPWLANLLLCGTVGIVSYQRAVLRLRPP